VVTKRNEVPAVKARKPNIKSNDGLRYRITVESVLPEKTPANEIGDPFATFSEWSSEADEKAYCDL
jgi:antitoxin PrlF